MVSEQNHEMQLVIQHPLGAEEWYCPTCGRRYLMQWTPSYNKVVLEVGDEFAVHIGSAGGLLISPTQVGITDEPELSEKLRAALEEALKDIDFDEPPTTGDS